MQPFSGNVITLRILNTATIVCERIEKIKVSR
jgi:hypothetical protein